MESRKKSKIYIETTVISYYSAHISRDIITAGHQQITREWWDNQISRYTPYVSEIVLDEISRGDPEAAQKRLYIVSDFDLLTIDKEVQKLSEIYYKALELSDKCKLDAMHLALAVQNGMDFLVSWNFVHIVGARPRKIIDEINFELGIKSTILCTPEELIEED